MTGKSTLVLGGARSGKSVYAEKLVENSGKPLIYIATGEALDDEMHQRIAGHQARRGEGWKTVEAPLHVCPALSLAAPGSVVLVDCVTLWVSNLMAADCDVEAEVRKLCQLLDSLTSDVVIVSNEVGLGIVPENALARRFRDEAGRANQMIAEACDRVVFVAAGQALMMKEEK